MPFLRFSRDKRGYANTYLCHTFRQDGAVRMRVLYWFRTPPDIEVGRPALDAGAMRDIEASNPGLTFDWDEILKAKPPPVPQERPGGERRERRPRRRGRAASPGDGTSAGAAGAGEPPSPRASSGGAVDARPAGAAPAAGEPTVEPDEPAAASGARRRRRRRRGRGPRAGGDRSVPTEAGDDAPAGPAPAGPDPDRT